MSMSSNSKLTVRLAVAHLSAAVTIFLAGMAAASSGSIVLGFTLMGVAVLYLMFELVTSKPLVENVPGMLRLLIAIFILAIFIGLNKSTIKGFSGHPTLTTEQHSAPTGMPSLVFPPSPTPTISHTSLTRTIPDYAPRISIIYNNKRIEIHNEGATDLYLYGAAYGDIDIPPESGEPRVIAPNAYYYLFADKLEDQFHADIGDNGQKLAPFHAFITTEDSRKYTVRGMLLGKVMNGVVSIHTQVLKTLDGWNNHTTQEESAPLDATQQHQWAVQKHLGTVFADGQHLYNDKCIGSPEYRGGEISAALTKSISDWEADTLRVLAGEVDPKVLTDWSNANMLSIDKSVDSHCMQFLSRLHAVQRILEKEFPRKP